MTAMSIKFWSRAIVAFLAAASLFGATLATTTSEADAWWWYNPGGGGSCSKHGATYVNPYYYAAYRADGSALGSGCHFAFASINYVTDKDVTSPMVISKGSVNYPMQVTLAAAMHSDA